MKYEVLNMFLNKINLEIHCFCLNKMITLANWVFLLSFSFPTATSNSTLEGLDNHDGGVCKTKSMKLTLKLGQSKYHPHRHPPYAHLLQCNDEDLYCHNGQTVDRYRRGCPRLCVSACNWNVMWACFLWLCQLSLFRACGEMEAALSQFIKFALKSCGIIPRSQKDARVVWYHVRTSFWFLFNIYWRALECLVSFLLTVYYLFVSRSNRLIFGEKLSHATSPKIPRQWRPKQL